MPTYLLEPLVEHMPAVEARRIYWMAQAARTPHLTDDSRDGWLRALEQLWVDLYPPPPAEVVEVEPEGAKVERDPEAARAYFESLGVKVD